MANGVTTISPSKEHWTRVTKNDTQTHTTTPYNCFRHTESLAEAEQEARGRTDAPWTNQQHTSQATSTPKHCMADLDLRTVDTDSHSIANK
ncbi:hypothetical protein Pcinc_034673 [Petrolisthes cinctipes]|uniref:Uncharacterized protein n=1 Tax=Petrolisthes cinctipes TaxID=88211 RepID=A0AAE1BZI8_PETCI|nr:hypothetical protein Pcinc_034673 [Petrolisthes cinctipes]